MGLVKRSNARVALVILGLTGAAVSVSAFGRQSAVGSAPPASTSAAQMTEAASAFLANLTATQREAATVAFTAENRTDWSNVPAFVHSRPGVRLGDLTDRQRLAAHALLRASLSSQGYQKVAGVIRLDGIHGALEIEALRRNGPPEDARPYFREEAESFGPGSYSIAILGTPSPDADWGWVIQGHHLAANFTVSKGRTAFTPLFLGATPLVLGHGIDSGWSALSHEVTRGFELMASLTPEQRSIAIEAGEVPTDVLAGVGRKHRLGEQAGLQAADMTGAQRRLLRVLVEEYVRNADFDTAQAQLETIAAAGWDGIRFAWRGPSDDAAEPLYYRIHGDRILIELSQRPNHIHTITRDPANDYGESWLGEVLTEEHTAADRFGAAVQAYESDNASR